MPHDDLSPDASAQAPPEVLQAEWSGEQVLALFADLSAGADVEHVQVRSRTGAGVEDRKTTLAEAESLFAAGSAQAVQIRYRFDGQSWCDTLLPQSDTVKIVRTRGYPNGS